MSRIEQVYVHEQQPLYPGPLKQSQYQQIEAAVDRHLALREREAWRLEAAYNRLLVESGGIMRGVQYSFATGGWAYWLAWYLLIPAFVGAYGLRGW